MSKIEAADNSNRLIQEKIIIGHLLLLFTADCPPDLIAQIKTALETNNLEWITAAERSQDLYTSTRRVFLPPTNHHTTNRIILKEKRRRLSLQIPKLKLPYFSTSVIHEIRTTAKLRTLLDQAELPSALTLDEKTYQLAWKVQKPLGAIINLQNQDQRYGIFEYIPHTSARDETTEYGGWNNLPEKTRVLFGQIHSALNKLAHQLLKHGLEPWDLGAHQIIYQLDEENSQINLWIIDTEEYNFAPEYGSFWPEPHEDTSLFPLLLFAGLNI